MFWGIREERKIPRGLKPMKERLKCLQQSKNYLRYLWIHKENF